MSTRTSDLVVSPGIALETPLPKHGGLILTTLILGEIVAMLNLSMGNVALPSIGMALNTSGTQLNWITDGFTLAMAASVLYFGALGDRYGRKRLFFLGALLSIPTALLATLAWSATVLIVGRLLSGIASAMLFPTTLSLISALWPAGAGRTRAIALWSGIGAGASALGPTLGGLLVQFLSWRWVFGISLPLVLVTLVLGWRLLPRHSGETSDPLDHLGGLLTVLFTGALIFAVNQIPQSGFSPLVIALLVLAVLALVLFLWQERRLAHPLMDLSIWQNRVFTGATVAATIVFGCLMGVMYIGQLYLQNVLGYSPLSAGLAVLPMSVCLIIGAQVGAQMLQASGSRVTMALGLALVGGAFVLMWLLWRQNTSYGVVLLAYLLIGFGIGMASAASTRSIMNALPITKAGIGSAVNDLTRDFGGAIGLSGMGALLAVRYTRYFTNVFAALPAAQAQRLSQQIITTISTSFAGAVQIARLSSPYAARILHAARTAFLQGADAAYLFGIGAALVAVLVIVFIYPKKAGEEATFALVVKEEQAAGNGDADQEGEPHR